MFNSIIAKAMSVEQGLAANLDASISAGTKSAKELRVARNEWMAPGAFGNGGFGFRFLKW